MGNVDPRPSALDELRAHVPHDRPLALVNLLRFADQVRLGDEVVSGEQAYTRYVGAIAPALVRAGGRPAFRGRVRMILIGPNEEQWDEVVVVWYPSRQAYERFVTSTEHRTAARYRSAALTDARLIAVTSPQRIGWLMAWLFAMNVRIRRR